MATLAEIRAKLASQWIQTGGSQTGGDNAIIHFGILQKVHLLY